MLAHPRTPEDDARLVQHLRLIHWFAAQLFATTDVRRAGLDADDFAQELALRVLKNLHRYDASRCKFATWLCSEGRWLAGQLRSQVRDRPNVLNSSTLTADGRDVDRFDMIPDPRAADPSAGVALHRVLVPVAELVRGAVPLAFVRDARTGHRVQVPTADVVEWRGRLFAVAVSFDESDDGFHRVRLTNDLLVWTVAAVRE